ncbi:MAG: NAD(P)H-dependent glycerol-3-phosphate dehydrogenase, partial [Candidatus Acidiferrum sp.]
DNGRILRERRENVRLLPGVPIPESIELTTDAAKSVSGADLWIVAIPTVFLRESLSRFVSIDSRAAILSLTKGFENETFLRPSEIIAQVLGEERIAVLSGPSHAQEVSRRLPASVVIASANEELAFSIQQTLRTDRFRIYTNMDVIGVELGGALKNIIGIAAGICEGLGLGDNARAALLTRGLAEMTRFGVAMGAEPATFAGLAGLGDLVTTCTSPHGRNRQVGLRLAHGERWIDIHKSMAMVAEGVNTARSVHERAKRAGLDMPITIEVYRVLYEDKDPSVAVTDLLMRRLKGET